MFGSKASRFGVACHAECLLLVPRRARNSRARPLSAACPLVDDWCRPCSPFSCVPLCGIWGWRHHESVWIAKDQPGDSLNARPHPSRPCRVSRHSSREGERSKVRRTESINCGGANFSFFVCLSSLQTPSDAHLPAPQNLRKNCSACRRSFSARCGGPWARLVWVRGRRRSCAAVSPGKVFFRSFMFAFIAAFEVLCAL